ncbi:hypothetical protein CC85DRAFT_301855 [Cutaneotrichosporon oleaginosum]|uniref:Extracellular membrane protein CFEM domain-containing protein n=1 Tax=Cutaneotrichosporon oleaginosum TaxID=879819 RepID=A0A0J0XPA0_9TREE|nr:uncharacterized protein CC85DRAFT_301855 [Cutaneotrichosporon oleaginosum]KLT42887.1 hypothetical protein CC85DRAFT_301855 [Cutaneotrichosporon oleaginosum]
MRIFASLAFAVTLALTLAVAAPPQPPQAPMRASEQFGLDLVDHASSCLRSCHGAATQVLILKNLGINSAVFITRNCQEKRWAELIGACLPMVCKSAPDVAYAVEYAHAWCARAGVRNVSITLPEWYMDSPGGEYYRCVNDRVR